MVAAARAQADGGGGAGRLQDLRRRDRGAARVRPRVDRDRPPAEGLRRAGGRGVASRGPDAPVGVVAAGHRLTARAGAEALAKGGGAVDAACAAAFAAAVAESPLTGPGAGGFLLTRAPDGATALLDFFVAVPGLGPAGRRLDPDALDSFTVPFGGADQVFHIGPASVAVPGMVAGIGEAHRRGGPAAAGRPRGARGADRPRGRGARPRVRLPAPHPRGDAHGHARRRGRLRAARPAARRGRAAGVPRAGRDPRAHRPGGGRDACATARWPRRSSATSPRRAASSRPTTWPPTGPSSARPWRSTTAA